ncbi:hypothetical protein JL2886_02673 [Phaeobacter gallaeciensis]|uniref:Uncharacterized protein n=1 Tax=Phaeobacter gallaeciensis TaxID=60890 RepID=A0A1B0ZTS1_9RHOB|nr:hypothetical protein JL2886_02673 [Phaeobacter gallaeciensis]
MTPSPIAPAQQLPAAAIGAALVRKAGANAVSESGYGLCRQNFHSKMISIKV